MQTKTYKTCSEVKTIDQFGAQTTGKYGVKAHCKQCYNGQQYQTVEYRRMHRYGLTVEAYQQLHNEQGGRCATCGVAPKTLQAMIDYLAGGVN